MNRKTIPCPEPRRQEVRVDADLDGLKDNEKRELEEFIPNTPIFS